MVAGRERGGFLDGHAELLSSWCRLTAITSVISLWPDILHDLMNVTRVIWLRDSYHPQHHTNLSYPLSNTIRRTLGLDIKGCPTTSGR